MPKMMFVRYRDRIEGWEGERVEAKLYEGMGSSMVGAEVRYLCWITWEAVLES